jgi:hypothetical protein
MGPALWLAAVGVSALAISAATGDHSAFLRGGSALLTECPAPLAWVLAACGFGWPLRRVLIGRDETSSRSASLQLGLGIAAALTMDVALGSLGLLGSAVAWGITLAGVVLALLCWRFDPPRAAPTSLLSLAAAPAVAVLLLAATSEPGWLWSTEFGGYDALSYHLQLPKEWLLAGQIGGTPHCVYGHLPSAMEAAFLHLMALRGSSAEAALSSAVAAQLLHALLALLAAWCTGQAAAAWLVAMDPRATAAGARSTAAAGRTAAVANVAVIATPWVVVVGSLAYTEMPVLLLLAAGLVLLAPPPESPAGLEPQESRVARSPGSRTHPLHVLRRPHISRSLAIGILAGAACGAKLTAAFFVALPLGVLLLWSLPWRRWPLAATSAIGGASLLLLPWLLRNAVTTGNPLFPFATSLLGLGHWSVEQARIFGGGHASELDVAQRLQRLWEQVMRFGVGAAPAPGEPWSAQWALTPWIGLLALSVLWWPARLGRAAQKLQPALAVTGSSGSQAQSSWPCAAARLSTVLLVQAAAWLTLSHLQSRFFIPAVVPMAMAAALASARLLALNRHDARSRQREAAPTWRPTGLALFVLLTGLSLLPAALLLRERGGAPLAAIGVRAVFTGDGAAGPSATDLPAHWLNHRLPEGARVLLIGDARPFWYRGTPASYAWQTTWDRGPVSAALARHPASPQHQRAELLAQGFTHLLIDPAMLDRWRRSGWNDPRLTPETMMALIDGAHVLHRFPGGALLVALTEE